MFDTVHSSEEQLGQSDAPFQWGAPPAWLSDDPEGNTGVFVSGDAPLPPSNDELVEGLAVARPGPLLGRRLAMIDLGVLTEDQALDVVAAMDLQAAFEAARRHQALAALARITTEDVLADASAEAVAAAGPDRLVALLHTWRVSALAARTGTSQGTAAHRLATGEALAPGGLLAATGAALATGAICDQRARLMSDRLLALDPVIAADIESAVLPLAGEMSWGRLDNALRRETIARQPKQEEAAHALARGQRKVTRPTAQPAGMASMGIFGPAEDMHQLWTALDARARQAKATASATTSHVTTSHVTTSHAAASHAATSDAATSDATASDVDTMDARRFDALIEAANAVLAEPDLPRRHGRRPAITVTVALSTLLGLDERPAELEDYGAITAGAARRIATDSTGTLRRLVLDAVGRATDYGTERYAPPQALAEFVIARDRTCTFPSCRRKADACDLDHRVPYPSGLTCCCNLQPMCRPHHQLKTLGLWTCRVDPASGDTRWTDRHGRTFTRLAATYVSSATPELDQIASDLRAGSPTSRLQIDRADALVPGAHPPPAHVPLPGDVVATGAHPPPGHAGCDDPPPF